MADQRPVLAGVVKAGSGDGAMANGPRTRGYDAVRWWYRARRARGVARLMFALFSRLSTAMPAGWSKLLLLPVLDYCTGYKRTQGTTRARTLDRVVRFRDRMFFSRPRSRSGFAAEYGRIAEVGCADLTARFGRSAADCQAAVNALLNTPAYDSQVPHQSSGAMRLPDASRNYWSHSIPASLAIPPVSGFLADGRFRDFVTGYFSALGPVRPVLYSVNSMVTFPHRDRHLVTNYHRDADDFLFLTVFIYWTACTREDGATLFRPGSHRGNRPDEDYGELALEGPAGSVFAFDSFGLHRGPTHLDAPRVVTWLRFGFAPTFTYVLDRDYVHGAELARAW